MSAQKYRDADVVDFAIVGSGAAGGVMARELAQAGLSVVLLEQGPRLSLADFTHDELKDWYLGGISNDAVRNPQTFRNDPAKKAAFQKFKPALWYGRAVGGASLHYTANYWRFRELDFIERSLLGAIPGTGFADWPITYADLEPYPLRRWRPRCAHRAAADDMGHSDGHRGSVLGQSGVCIAEQRWAKGVAW